MLKRMWNTPKRSWQKAWVSSRQTWPCRSFRVSSSAHSCTSETFFPGLEYRLVFLRFDKGLEFRVVLLERLHGFGAIAFFVEQFVELRILLAQFLQRRIALLADEHDL